MASERAVVAAMREKAKLAQGKSSVLSGAEWDHILTESKYARGLNYAVANFE